MRVLLHIFLIVALTPWISASAALTPYQAECIQKRIELELRLNPAYVWGAADLKPGVPGDCSGKLYAIFKSCGVDVKRTQSIKMAAGLSGWGFEYVDYFEAKSLALVFMTTIPGRPQGHVGVLIDNVFLGITRMAHASSKWGFIAVTVEPDEDNYYYPKIDWLRQPEAKEAK